MANAICAEAIEACLRCRMIDWVRMSYPYLSGHFSAYFAFFSMHCSSLVNLHLAADLRALQRWSLP
jgi:hypothetical protein